MKPSASACLGQRERRRGRSPGGGSDVAVGHQGAAAMSQSATRGSTMPQPARRANYTVLAEKLAGDGFTKHLVLH